MNGCTASLVTSISRFTDPGLLSVGQAAEVVDGSGLRVVSVYVPADPHSAR